MTLMLSDSLISIHESRPIYGPTCRSISVDPCKQDTLTQCCVDVGSPSTMLAQHQTNGGSMSRVCCGG